MEQLIQIRSVKQYFKEFIEKNANELQSPVVKAQVKMQILDAFRREVFEQIADKIGPEAATMSRDELAKIETVHNILKNSFRKWRRLCMLSNECGLINWLCLEDLKKILEDDEKPEDSHILEETSIQDGDEVVTSGYVQVVDENAEETAEGM